MCLTIKEKVVGWEKCFGLLREFNSHEQLNIPLLRNLYPEIPWNEI